MNMNNDEYRIMCCFSLDIRVDLWMGFVDGVLYFQVVYEND